MHDQKESLITEKEDLRGRMQQKIDELLEQLERELANASGNAREIQERLQQEINLLKKQLEDRTGQLADASQQILDQNQEIQSLRE